MASPVVAGLAALLLEYYPSLSARQIKEVIERSSLPISDSVRTPGTGQLTTLSNLSKTGGLVNAYEAVKLAASIKGERKLSVNKMSEKAATLPPVPKKTKGF
jgi:subtilisin family serine protease